MKKSLIILSIMSLFVSTITNAKELSMSDNKNIKIIYYNDNSISDIYIKNGKVSSISLPEGEEIKETALGIDNFNVAVSNNEVYIRSNVPVINDNVITYTNLLVITNKSKYEFNLKLIDEKEVKDKPSFYEIQRD